jgi:hypothetical membrane protein
MKLSATEQEYGAARYLAAGIVWFCAIQFFVAQIIVGSRWTTPFSLTANNISDLGNTVCGIYPSTGGTFVCSPWYGVMNVSFALQGIIIIAGSLLARPLAHPSRVRSIIFWLLVITGAGVFGVGIFPENINNTAHVISAGIQFVTGNLGILILGLAAIRTRGTRSFALASAALGISGLAATVLFATRVDLGMGLGTIERIAAYTFPVWLIAAGTIILIKRPRSRRLQLA